LHAAPGDAWAWLHLVLSVYDLSALARPMGAMMPDTLAGVGGTRSARLSRTGLIVVDTT
jgi:hypothetical protein